MADPDPFDVIQDAPPSDTRNPWDPFWMARTGGLWYRPNEQAYFKKADNAENAAYIDKRFVNRPDVPVEDQRGLTLPELDLQAKFQKLRGLSSWDPKAITPLDPTASQSPMAQALGYNDTDAAAKEVAKEIALRHAGEILSMHVPERRKLEGKVRKVK
jgi:hypothetical protein